MCRDIELYWGEPVESLRQRFQTELEIMNGYEHISLSNCSMKLARELIINHCVYVSSSNTYEGGNEQVIKWR